MRKLIFLILLIVSLGIRAQNVWEQDTVVNAPDKTPEQIVSCATQWAATNFAQFSPVISTEGNTVTIILDLPFNIKNLSYSAGSGYITGEIKIQTREGRFKITLSNFNHFSTNNSYADWWSMGLILDSTPQQWVKGMKWKQKREVYKRVLEKLNEFSESVFNSAANQIPNCVPKEEEDW